MRKGVVLLKTFNRNDDRGSIEGLPLQLMIIGLIASLGTAVIVGWISSIETPTYVGEVELSPDFIAVTDEDGDGKFDANMEKLELRILDTSGKGINGALILLEGASICNEHHRILGTTNQEGFVAFDDLRIEVSGDRIATILVTVNGQGISDEYRTEILVIPA